MTLGDFFEAVGNNPQPTIFYFLALPIAAYLLDIFAKDEGHLSPWRYIYSGLIYLCSIPGIFAITLSIYLFFFERRSVMDINIYTQILPILSMVVTLWLIRRNITFESIPGFDRMTSLLTLLLALIGVMWVLDRTRIWAITFVPFHYFIIFFIAILILVRVCWKGMFKSAVEKV